MKVFWSRAHERHRPQFFIYRGNVRLHHEQPERVEALLNAALGVGMTPSEVALSVEHPLEYRPPSLLAAHDGDYVEFILGAYERWAALDGSGPEIIPNVHPLPASTARPSALIGQAGLFLGDTASPIGPGTGIAALSAACVAKEAVTEIAEAQARAAYALCRPCGHHATRSVAGGGCFFNNAAIAALSLRETVDRVAILDIDAHHGNGTQSIFYERGDVLTVSIHVDPDQFYPFYWGYADERGAGAGEERNINLPVAVGAGDDAWLGAVERGCSAIEAFGADAIVVPLGLDSHESDPLNAMRVTNQGFARAGERIGRLRRPTLVVQEGGYLSSMLGPAAAVFLEAFRSAH